MATDCRVAAAQALAAVLGHGQSLNVALPAVENSVVPRDQGLLRELCYGTLRHYPSLQTLANALLDKPLKDRDSDVRALLLIGLYQIIHLRVPDHAAVSSAVDATKGLKKSWARGLVNAVLRRYLREGERLQAELPEHASLDHPRWLLRSLRDQWPEHWEAMVSANNTAPPMCLRVNAQRATIDRYSKLLTEEGIEATTGEWASSCLRLGTPVDITALPGFAGGLASVQDEAGQLAANLLGPQPGERILDACAAPGGKACHIAEMCPELQSLVALELNPNRATRIAENRERLALAFDIVVGDAADPAALAPDLRFDRILVDAPCSASGVIRRHPDVKVLRRPSDLAGFATTQLAILQGLWPRLSPGGVLLYATCSVLREENDAVVRAFMDRHPEAEVDTIQADWGEATEFGRQLLPSLGGPDGLYYCHLRAPQ